MALAPKELESLMQYFNIEADESGRTIKCKECPQQWHLKKGGEEHPGNFLHLLNHAYGHGE